MLATVEVRWFRPGVAPGEVQGWFSNLPGPQIRQPDRTDYYLKMPAEGSLGIKLRGEWIEIKQQESSFGLVLFQRGVIGKAAGWRKWRFTLGETEGKFPTSSEDMACWTPVKKTRILRRLRRTETGDFHVASPDVILPQGCDLELTEVRIKTKPWWTLALEAYGPAETLYEHLIQAAGMFFESPYPETLHEDSSLSYPGWLHAFDH